MGKVKPAPQGADKKDTRIIPRSSRGTTSKEDNTIAVTPAAAPSNVERRRLAATLPGSNTASGAKRPPSTGRKLSALSAHKRRRPTDATPGKTPNTNGSKKQIISSPPQKQATGTPSQEPQIKAVKSPPNKGAPPMTVAEVKKKTSLVLTVGVRLFPPCLFSSIEVL